MLTIYFDGEILPNNKEYVKDVEEGFKKLRINETELNKKLIAKIDNAKWNDNHSFIDRFGFKLYMSELSTGCKAALLVNNMPEAIINTRECGLNARDMIISLCSEGNILMVDNGITFMDFSEKELQVKVDQYKFCTIDRLNDYIQNERPFKPNMKKEGIEHV